MKTSLAAIASVVVLLIPCQDADERRGHAQEVQRKCAELLATIDGVLSVSLAGSGVDDRLLVAVRDEPARDAARTLLGGDTYREVKILWSLRPAASERPAAPPSAKKTAPAHVCPPADPKKVDQAIRKAAAYLRGLEEFRFNKKNAITAEELVILTLHHAGIPADDPKLQRVLKSVLESPLTTTYKVSLQAAALVALDPVKYQRRIAECAQFLVDTQSEEGGWGYGGLPGPFEPEFAKEEPAPGNAGRPGVATGPAGAGGSPAPPLQAKRMGRKILLQDPSDPRSGPGDESNSQYAVLGLRAGLEANVHPPRATLRRAEKYWERGQHPSGGWGYRGGLSPSMSAGGLGSLLILRQALGRTSETDLAVLGAIQGLNDRFNVDFDPERGFPFHYFYYMYGLERAGTLSRRATFGGHDWYREGAHRLLELQDGNGTWRQAQHPRAEPHYGPISDTCFAVLFLKRATSSWAEVTTPGSPVATPGRGRADPFRWEILRVFSVRATYGLPPTSPDARHTAFYEALEKACRLAKAPVRRAAPPGAARAGVEDHRIFERDAIAESAFPEVIRDPATWEKVIRLLREDVKVPSSTIAALENAKLDFQKEFVLALQFPQERKPWGDWPRSSFDIGPSEDDTLVVHLRTGRESDPPRPELPKDARGVTFKKTYLLFLRIAGPPKDIVIRPEEWIER